MGLLPSTGDSSPRVINKAKPPDPSLPSDCCTLILEPLSRKSRETGLGVVFEGDDGTVAERSASLNKGNDFWWNI